MIALIASVLLGFYIFLPEFLFKKLAFNFRVVTKTTRDDLKTSSPALVFRYLHFSLPPSSLGHAAFPATGLSQSNKAQLRNTWTTEL